MIDTFFSILFGIPYLIAFWCIMWWVVVSNFWYALLLPFYVGLGFSVSRKTPKWALLGFAASWTISWILGFIVLCSVRID